MNNIVFDQSFLEILLNSPSFWQSVVVWSVGFILGMIASIYIVVKFLRKKSFFLLHKNQYGSARIVDMAFTLPIFMLINLSVVQFAILANDSLIVHYAAYSAARSMRVSWHPLTCPLNPIMQTMPSQIENFVAKIPLLTLCTTKSETAARLALIPAASSSSRICDSKHLNCEKLPIEIEHTMKNLVYTSGFENRKMHENGLIAKAKYAFHKKNLDIKVYAAGEVKSDLIGEAVDIFGVTGNNYEGSGEFARAIKDYYNHKGWIPIIKSHDRLLASFRPPAITANLSFTTPILLPIGPLFGKKTLLNSSTAYFRKINAIVTVK